MRVFWNLYRKRTLDVNKTFLRLRIFKGMLRNDKLYRSVNSHIHRTVLMVKSNNRAISE